MDDKDRDREISREDQGAEGAFGQGTDGVLGATAGGGTGAVVGTVMGAALGGPVGALVGAGVGTVAGAIGGYAIDYNSHEPEFREYHRTAHPQGRHTFEEASPAYRYGWESYDTNPEFHDATYDKLRPALHKGE